MHLARNPLIGYVYGAKDEQRFNKVVKFDIQVAASIALFLTVILFSLSLPRLFRIFLSDPKQIVQRLDFAGCQFRLLAGIDFFCFHKPCLNQWEKQRLHFGSHSVVRVDFQGVISISAKLFGYTGIIAAQAISDCLTFILALIFFYCYSPRFK